MKHVWITLIINLIGIVSFAQNDINGTWESAKNKIRVSIYSDNDSYTAKVISSKNSEIEPGEIIAKNLKQVKRKWKGLMYNPETQEWVNIQGKISKRYLYVKDFSGFFTRSHAWKRV